MASFTDKTPTFNPYIQQMPVEQMVSVGVEKQRRYDEGVQKIQTQIDNVAGLDVIRDIDKQYLQSKMNELGNRLKVVAGSDFSNYQLVNSVSGMTTQIARDPIVQNSVMSTQRVRKALSDKEAAKKNGKSSVENDWWLDKTVNEYLNNPETGAAFSGGYVEYRDVMPKMLEVLKSLHESGKDEQIPWVTNADGTIDQTKTAAVMVEQVKKGITSPQIENAIRASLDQNDLRQLSISGQYQYKDFTPNDLVKHAQDQYTQGIKSVESRISDLQKYAESHKSPKDSNLYNQAMATIKELQASIGQEGDFRNSLKAELDNSLKAITTNPEAVKAELYKNGFIKQFAKAHSWEESATKYLTNPYVEVDHWERKFGIDQALANSTIFHQREMERMDRAKFSLSERELELKEKNAKGGAGFVTSGGLEQEVQSPQTKISDEILSTKRQADAMLVDLAQRVSTSMINNGADPSTRITVPELQAMIIKGQLGPEFQSSVDAYKQTMAAAGDKAAAYDAAVLAAKNDRNLIANEQLIQQELNQHRPLTITTADGQQLTYTPQEILEYLRKPKGRTQLSFSPYGGQGVVEDLSKLSAKERILYATKYATILADEYKPIFDKYGEHVRQYNAVLDQEILKRVPEYVPKEVSLGDSVEKTRQYRNLATQVLGRVKDQKGGNAGLDPEELSKWLTDEKTKSDLTYSISNNGKEKQLVIRNGDKVQRITLDQREIRQLPEAADSPSVTMQNILLQRGGTTNYMKGDPQGARYDKLPNIKKYQVAADVNSDPTDTSIVFPKVYVNTVDGWKTLIFKEPMTPTNALAAINSLTDAYILDKIKEQLPQYVNKLITK